MTNTYLGCRRALSDVVGYTIKEQMPLHIDGYHHKEVYGIVVSAEFPYHYRGHHGNGFVESKVILKMASKVV